ncbi:FG-GAP-like repeat-containing protein [Arthrobacter sp. SAFR-014]|uniref:FG-GAP repeat domain-containing protein n=1 Tax=unclassified Arthrobacter TaxID=235627 RepID=UPI003F7BEFA3
MRSFSRSIASVTGLLVLAAGLVSLPAAASVAATDPAAGGTTLPAESPTEQEHHGYESAPGVPMDEPPAGLALQTEAGVTAPVPITVKLVVATLVDNKALVPMAQAEAAVTASSNYWKAMSGGRISMTVTERATLASKTARSTDSYYDMINKITSELKWTYSANKALVIFVPSDTLAGGALGAGYSSNGNSGRVLMPKISGFTNSVIAHEFGHVLGSMHADALQCGSGVSDVGVTSTGQFTDSSCYIREYGDSTDLMGLSSYNMPVISSPFWEARGLGNGTDVRDLGVASGVKSYTLKPWGDTKLAYRAVKFADPASREVYYLELRQPVGYDTYLASGYAGNRGVKVVQRGGATPSSSLALMPSTVPFSGYYATNHTWQAGSTFTTNAGTRVTINSVTATSATVTIDADPGRKARIRFSAGDFDGDGRPDMLSRETDGSLMLNAGQPGNKLGAPKRIAGGWNIFNTVVGDADFTGDGQADLLGRTSEGELWLYPGNGQAGFLPRIRIGGGWQIFQRIVTPGDLTGDGKRDLAGIKPDGTLWLYPGDGKSGFLAPTQAGTGWNGFTAVSPASGFGGRVGGLLARSSDGSLSFYAGNGAGAFREPVRLGAGWGAFETIIGGHDFSGDGQTDVLVGTSAGTLALYPGTGGSRLAPRVSLGTGWNKYSQVWGAGDMTGDGRTDVLALTPQGQLFLHPGNGSGGFTAARLLNSGWQTYSQIFSAGNIDGSGGPDIVARAADGRLWIYPSDGKGTLLARKLIGAGWQGFTRILSPGDFTGDGKSDLMAQTPDSRLWVYPGNGRGGLLARRALGSNWNVFSQLIPAGDITADGKQDILARTAAGDLWLYPGNGTGGALPRRQLSGGWAAYKPLVAAGRLTGTNSTSLLAPSADGTLWLYSLSSWGTFQNVVLNPR